MNKRSKIWDFFEIHSDDNTKAICLLCKIPISRGGIGKRATTSAMIKHLQNKHITEYNENFQSQSAENKKQSNIADYVKTQKWNINDKKSLNLHKAIGEMIALDNQPFSIVTDIGFQKLMECAEPRYKIPFKTYFSETVIPDIYEKCRIKILKDIENISNCAFTSDIWTCNISNESYISFTIHYINEDFQLKHAALNVKHFPGSHTGENIAKIITEMIEEWHLNDKNYIIIRDSGANIKKATKNLDIQNESCFIHTLQLVVTEALKSQRTVNDLIAVSRKIVTHFNHSPAACYKLKAIQRELNMPTLKLVQDVQTRWNSTFYMLQRLFELKRAISIFTIETEAIVNLSSHQWSLLENCLKLLQPFEEITKEISSSESIISEVIPIVASLKKYLLKEISFFGVGTMKDSLIQNVNNRFNNILLNINYTHATFLDPRFKTAFFDNDMSSKIKIEIYHKMQEISQEHEILESDDLNNSESNNDIDDESLTTFRRKETIWTCFSEIANASDASTSACGNAISNRNSSNTESNTKSCEIDTYLSMKLIERIESPFLWWHDNRKILPILSKLAEKYLCIPANSVYSERLFSKAGIVYEKKRNRLLPDNGEKLIFLHHNLPLLNYQY
nr:PREDICTED: zinc finger BED domain-containing protein 4-like [Linepithema humile]